jgi:hypothetical protein
VRFSNSAGDSQESNGRPSSEHSNVRFSVRVRVSLPVNVNVASVAGVDVGGPMTIVVFGGAVSGPSTAVHS